MRVRRPVSRISKAPMVPLVAAVVLFGPASGTSAVSACEGWTVLQPPSPGTQGLLTGVAAVSPRSAWAVGQYVNKKSGVSALLLRWDGTAWTQVPSQNPGGFANASLSAVAATSSTNVWAVGRHANGSLILLWNGIRWTRVPSPNPAGFTGASLSGVAATSPTNAWAVGAYTSRSLILHSLILHWNGIRWKRVPGPLDGLTAVTATSSTNAWAVGCTSICGPNDAPGDRTLILHWNGTRWERVRSPNPAGRSEDNFLFGVAATSPTNAWAVGYYSQGQGEQTLIAHWNGATWKRVPSPNPDSFVSGLSGVAAASSTNAWAVGGAGDGYLIAHWNGVRWKQVPGPIPGASGDGLIGVAALSSGTIWAVGTHTSNGFAQHTIAFRRCS